MADRWNLREAYWEKPALDPSGRAGFYPRLDFRIVADRKPQFFVTNYIAVYYIVIAISFSAFALETDDLASRLNMSLTLLLSAVAFKLLSAQALPDLPYLTYLDKYCIAGLLVICMNVVALVLHDKLLADSDRESAVFNAAWASGIFVCWTGGTVYLIRRALQEAVIACCSCKEHKSHAEQKKTHKEELAELQKQKDDFVTKMKTDHHIDDWTKEKIESMGKKGEVDGVIVKLTRKQHRQRRLSRRASSRSKVAPAQQDEPVNAILHPVRETAPGKLTVDGFI